MPPTAAAATYTYLLVREHKSHAKGEKLDDGPRPDTYHAKMREELLDGLLHPRPTKTLPIHYKYDELGSKLFQEASLHPDYYVKRTEIELLRTHAAHILRTTNPTAILELGAGDCVKSGELMRSGVVSAVGARLSEFWPLDIDAGILREVCPQLAAEFTTIGVNAIVADYEHQLEAIDEEVARRRKGPILFACFGNTIGNLVSERERLGFLKSICGFFDSNNSDDRLLLGLSLVGDERRLVASFDTAPGRAFSRNIFTVLNRELGTNFRNDAYSLDYEYRGTSTEGRIDGYFRPTSTQRIVIPPLAGTTQRPVEVDIEAGEMVHVSYSAKFTREGVETLFQQAGMELCGWFTDAQELFALALAKKRRAI